MISKNRGVVYELDGTSITTSYQSPTLTTDQYTSLCQRRRFTLEAALKAVGTNITAVVIKLQASRDGVIWYNIMSVNDIDGVERAEQTFNTIVSNTISGSIYTDGGFLFLRVAVKVSGGAGQATETLKISAVDAVIARSVTSAMIEDDAVVEAKIDDGAVTEAKLGDGAVDTVKLADDTVTAAKLDDAATVYSAFTGHNNTGACTLTGAKVGDKVQGVVNMTDGGNAAASFETTITVADQIQQTSASDLSTKKFSLLLLKRGT